MEKLTINIDPEDWGNLITKYNPHSPKLSESDFSNGTINLDTDTTGSLSKRKGGPNYNPTLLPSAPKDQYEAIFSDGVRHLLVVTNGTFYYSSGDTVFNAVTNGSGFSTGGNFEFATTQDRVYGGNAINAPIVYDRNGIYGGAAPVTVPRIKTMGAQVPATFVAAAVAAGGAVPVGQHNYKVTFVYYDSEESNGSPAMAAPVTTTAGNQTINLTSVPIGGYGVTQRKIYRDDNDGNYLHIGTINNNTATTFSDVLAVGVTPTLIPTNNGTAPSFGLIALWLDRLWVAQVPGDPNTLFYSEAALPDIFGFENQVLCNQEDPITALVVYFDRLIVFNRRSMGQIIGDTPDSFRYSAIPSSVGCVDNRTLQTHVLKGVPVLIWLSERGFYTYDGNAIDYISDPIEDLVNYNIRQALQQKNSNAQTSFTSGTPSNGIDTTLLSSEITTRGYDEGTSLVGNNPRRSWNDQLDWEGGAYRSQLRTKNQSNLDTVPSFTPSFPDGVNSGLVVAPGSLSLATTTIYTGETSASMGADYMDTRVIIPPVDGMTKIAVAFVPSRDGSITSVSMRLPSYYNGSGFQSRGYSSVRYRIETDSSNSPSGTSLGTTNPGSTSLDFSYSLSFLSPIHLTGGTKYWIVAYNGVFGGFKQGSKLSGNKTLVKQKLNNFGSETAWQNPDNVDPWCSFAFSYDKYTASGSWTSTIYDSKCDAFDAGRNFKKILQGTSNDPLFTVARTYIDILGSNDATFATSTVVSADEYYVFPLPQVAPFQNFRYWKIRIRLTTSDNVYTDTINSATLYFMESAQANWDSEVIDTTTDSTIFNGLAVTSSLPSGTTLVTQIATSASPTGPWTGTGNADGQFGLFASHIVRRYVKIRLNFTTDVAQTLSPSVSSINFTWTLVSTFVSPIVDTGTTPAGWDVFLAQYDDNAGTVQFEMRSATTSGGIPAATFYVVTPGDFPTVVSPLQFTQWRVTLTSADGTVPSVQSVTIQWFLSLVASIRPASIFVDGRYYVALAELNQTINNLIIQLDLNGKWRRFSGISVATLSFFFNRPYYGLSTSGQIRRFLEGYNDGGAAIEFDVRTKAFDFSTKYKEISEKQKVIGEIIVHAKNTGALLQFFYSPDEGQTFYPFCTLSGATSYQTTAAGNDFFLRLKPIWTGVGTPQITGQHMMYRIYNNDTFPVEIHSLKATIFVRKQPPVITG